MSDYQADPLTGRPVSWRIEALDEPEPVRHGDTETAAALRASAAWLRTMFAILPLAVGVRVDDPHKLGHEIAQVANQFADPYQVPDANFGWSARDACYAYGSFVLDDDEALVITHRPPKCRFWNLVVWNQFMAAHNVNDARSSVNGHSAVPNADGSVTIVISRGMTAHPNSLTTLDYPRGNLAFRWFLADEVPARPDVQLVKVSRRADERGLSAPPPIVDSTAPTPGTAYQPSSRASVNETPLARKWQALPATGPPNSCRTSPPLLAGVTQTPSWSRRGTRAVDRGCYVQIFADFRTKHPHSASVEIECFYLGGPGLPLRYDSCRTVSQPVRGRGGHAGDP